ncbi:MAG: hypothetical protein QNL04_06880 [SAR324 cluster bacterium]|nr:hypothetical protein [SAR324 cluster bacterium]
MHNKELLTNTKEDDFYGYFEKGLGLILAVHFIVRVYVIYFVIDVN